jgi:hypothetical protein
MGTTFIMPTADAVRAACKHFADDPNEPDTALFDLFAQYPKNTNLDHVLLKVVTLNTLYSTQIPLYSRRIPTVWDVARHIVELNIDLELQQGSPELVLKISKIAWKDDRYLYNYSFATKYCSFHQPDSYPIWDSRVNKYLMLLRKREAPKDGGFRRFKQDDLWDYIKFKEILTQFRKHFGIETFTFKQVDAFLYIEGGKLFIEKADPEARK